MIVFRLYLDKDKETEWLNEMSAKGYAMKSFFAGFYSFVPCEKNEWQYQIDIGKGFFNVKKSYAEFMEEMDIDIIQSWGPWVILRRKTREGEFSLYTDVDSRIAQYKKILLTYKIAGLFELLLLIYSVYCGVIGVPYAWPVVFFICAIVIVFMNAIIRTQNTIIKLKEQKGEASLKSRGRKLSPAIPLGFLINAVNLLMGDYIPFPLRLVCLGFSVGLILYGSVVTAIRKQ